MFAITLANSNGAEDVEPWLLPGAQPPLNITTITEAASQPLRLLPPAPGQLDLAALKLYKLHKHSVVRVEDIRVALPPGLKSYKLHGKQVLRLADLELALAGALPPIHEGFGIMDGLVSGNKQVKKPLECLTANDSELQPINPLC